MEHGPGRRLKVRLVRSGRKAKDVAQQAGISQTRLSRILNDRVSVSRNLEKRLRSVIDTDLPMTAKEETTAGANEAPPAV